MANRHRKYIQTGRAQLYIDVTANEKPGQGSVTLTGGNSGSITALTVNGVSIITNAVAYATSLAVTAGKLADEINRTISSPNYHARAIGAKVYIWQQTVVAGTITLASTVTGTLTKTDADVSGGQVGNGTPLGYVENGFELFVNDEWLKEVTDESGVGVVKQFYSGENAQIACVLKQWDSDVLGFRFPGRHTTSSDVNRVQLPGTILPGDPSTPYEKVIELRPDNKLFPTLVARRAMNAGNGTAAIPFSSQNRKKLTLLIDCMKDEDDASDYATLAIDLGQNITL